VRLKKSRFHEQNEARNGQTKSIILHGTSLRHPASHFVEKLKFEHVMNAGVSVVNVIPSHALNLRQIQSFLCNLMQNMATSYTIQREVRRLIRGTLLKRSLALRLETEMFLNEEGKLRLKLITKICFGIWH